MSRYRLRQPQLAAMDDTMLAPALRTALDGGALADVVREPHPGVAEVELFTEAACQAFLRELHAFEHHCHRTGRKPTRPNSMNAYGVVLSELGLEYAMDDLLGRCIAPIARAFLGRFAASKLDHQHAFVVEYAEGADTELGFHVDDSEVTLNVCLGWEFTGSSVYFEGPRCDAHRQTPARDDERWEWSPSPGRALLHGGANRHGVRPLTSGRRTNLIVWARSSAHRRAHRAPHEPPAAFCPLCAAAA